MMLLPTTIELTTQVIPSHLIDQDDDSYAAQMILRLGFVDVGIFQIELFVLDAMGIALRGASG